MHQLNIWGIALLLGSFSLASTAATLVARAPTADATQIITGNGPLSANAAGETFLVAPRFATLSQAFGRFDRPHARLCELRCDRIGNSLVVG